jgi:hypothetical protein
MKEGRSSTRGEMINRDVIIPEYSIRDVGLSREWTINIHNTWNISLV